MVNSWLKRLSLILLQPIGYRMLVASLVTGSGLPAMAIVIRHDTGYSRYLAREADYPAVFPLQRHERSKTCAATLISPQWALTAAHCIEEIPLYESWQAGRAYSILVEGSAYQVVDVHLHPQWPGAPGTVWAQDQVDLALLELNRPVHHVEPVALYRDEDELGQVLTFLGWGYSGFGSTDDRVNDGRLRFARNAVWRADEQLRFVFDDPLHPGSQAVDFEGIPGLGDSGGPALLQDSEQTWLVGVAVGEMARTERRGAYGATVLYERVSRHVEWIESVMRPKRAMICYTLPNP